MYGSWESAVYQGKKLDAKGQTEERLKALQGFEKIKQTSSLGKT